MTKITFSNKKNIFFRTLKGKVDNYFTERGVHSSGSKRLYLKSAIQVTSAVVLYLAIMILSPGLWVSIPLFILLGLNLAMLGFNVMHEGAHNSFSRRAWLNKFSAFFLNILGGNTFFWKIKHNINHHTFTNIEGHDADIDIRPFMRLSNEQKRYSIHRFQHIYWVLLYSASYFLWIFLQDFLKYFTGNIAPGNQQKMSINDHIIFWASKVWYVMIFLVTPIIILGPAKAMIGFAAMGVACSLFLSIVFQLAHTVESTSFPVPNAETNKIEEEWAIHQLSTTSNFATNNKLISWLLGGLNFQVEHHLFPRVSHIHYPQINRIVKEHCLEYNVAYLEYPTMREAMGAHLRHIRRLGRAD